MKKKVELLAPAGNLEKLIMALEYGADAVYIGGGEFGLRAGADNFTLKEMKNGVDYAHTRKRKVYLALNAIVHNEELKRLPGYIKKAAATNIDAVIVADPGVFSMVRENAPGLSVHLSTQANNTNWKSAEFWYERGIKRIVLAREITLEEIVQIRKKTPKKLELEVFVHGAMCISYSGRCLLSNYMAHRDSNRGDCAHPCRWKYSLVEEKRPSEYYPVYENDKGTFIFNSRDLCMIEHIPQLIETGVTSLKIEGRMKSSYYTATVTSAYRKAIDAWYESRKNNTDYLFDKSWLFEINKASHREFTTGFYFGKSGSSESKAAKSQTNEKTKGNYRHDINAQVYANSSYIREYDFIGLVMNYDNNTGIAEVEQRNRMLKGDEIEVLNPDGSVYSCKIEFMKDQENNLIETAPHPQMKVFMKLPPTCRYAILRRKSN